MQALLLPPVPAQDGTLPPLPSPSSSDRAGSLSSPLCPSPSRVRAVRVSRSLPDRFQCADSCVVLAEAPALTHSAVPYIIPCSCSPRCNCCIFLEQPGSAETSWNPKCQGITGRSLLPLNVPVKAKSFRWGSADQLDMFLVAKG